MSKYITCIFESVQFGTTLSFKYCKEECIEIVWNMSKPLIFLDLQTTEIVWNVSKPLIFLSWPVFLMKWGYGFYYFKDTVQVWDGVILLEKSVESKKKKYEVSEKRRIGER